MPRAPGPQLRLISQLELDQMVFAHGRFLKRQGGHRAIFRSCDLSHLDLSGQNLPEADFTGAVLYGTRLAGARMTAATFYGADLRLTNFEAADLTRCDMRGACLRGAR